MLLPQVVLTNTASVDSGAVERLIQASADLLIKSPQALITVLLAWFSGNVWTYIILSHFSKKERKILNSNLSKVSIGLFWFSLIFVFFHFVMHQNLIITFTNVLDSLVSVLIISLALQFIVLFFASVVNRKGNG